MIKIKFRKKELLYNSTLIGEQKLLTVTERGQRPRAIRAAPEPAAPERGAASSPRSAPWSWAHTRSVSFAEQSASQSSRGGWDGCPSSFCCRYPSPYLLAGGNVCWGLSSAPPILSLLSPACGRPVGAAVGERGKSDIDVPPRNSQLN